MIKFDLFFSSDTEGKGYMWNKVTYPGMKQAVVNVLMATQDVAEGRKVRRTYVTVSYVCFIVHVAEL